MRTVGLSELNLSRFVQRTHAQPVTDIGRRLIEWLHVSRLVEVEELEPRAATIEQREPPCPPLNIATWLPSYLEYGTTILSTTLSTSRTVFNDVIRSCTGTR